jgi:hypothetical protein
MTDWIACAVAWTDLHPGAAAWVQAFFSIVAISIAIYVPYRQHTRDVRLARQLRMEDQLRSMEAAAGIVINAMNLIQDAWKGTEKPDDTPGYILKGGYDRAAFDFAARALEEINLASVPDAELIMPIFEMRNLVIKARGLPVAIHKADEASDKDPVELRRRLRCVREDANRQTVAMEAAVNRLRDEVTPERVH